jgi:hypothetical protein
MALTDTFVRTAKFTKPAGQKQADGNCMYLPVTPTIQQPRTQSCFAVIQRLP